MKSIVGLFEKQGWILLLLVVICTLLKSVFFDVDYANPDYFWYMRFVNEGNYAREPFVAGTIALCDPIAKMLGNNLLSWRLWAWGMNFLIFAIPYVFLLNNEQRRKSAFVAALALCLIEGRYGLEPPKFVYLFYAIMMTCFVTYYKSQKFIYVVIISLMCALIGFVRFPSVFVWPVIVVAFFIKKSPFCHRVTIASLPILLFVVLVSCTNEGIIQYFSDVRTYMKESAAQDHAAHIIFFSEVKTTILAIIYTSFILLPFLCNRYIKQKWSDNKIIKVGCIVPIIAIYLIHPTPHHGFALVLAVFILGLYAVSWNLDSVVLCAAIAIGAMFCSVGSDCGFIHDYYSIVFLPYIVYNLGNYIGGEHNLVRIDRNFKRILFLMVSIIIFAHELSFVMEFQKEYVSKGHISIVDGNVVSEKFKGVALTQKSGEHLGQLQKEYESYNKKNKDAIFWGRASHWMSFINDKYPVTNMWEITSANKDGKAFKDFCSYIEKNYPVVIDTENHENTRRFLLEKGYHSIDKQHYVIYER